MHQCSWPRWKWHLRNVGLGFCFWMETQGGKSPSRCSQTFPCLDICVEVHTSHYDKGKHRWFRTALSIPFTHLERESAGSVSEQGFLSLHQGASGSFSARIPLHHCREGGNTVMERCACFWLATTERERINSGRQNLTNTQKLQAKKREAHETFISLLKIGWLQRWCLSRSLGSLWSDSDSLSCWLISSRKNSCICLHLSPQLALQLNSNIHSCVSYRSLRYRDKLLNPLWSGPYFQPSMD